MGQPTGRTMKTDVWYRFSKNHLAVAGSVVVVLLFALAEAGRHGEHGAAGSPAQTGTDIAD